MDKSEWMDEGGVNTGKIEVLKFTYVMRQI